MAGLLPPDCEREALMPTYVHNLRWAAAQAAQHKVQVLIEPINTRDMPGYFLNRQDHAHALLDAVDSPHLKVQMDLYHCQIVEGDVATKLRQYLPTGRVAHLQIAGVPERHEPDHPVRLDGGPVVKTNTSARYATDAGSAALVLDLARSLDIPTQQFVSRNDMPCGSTIGPVTAARLGIPTVDVGVAQLSMHSSRELTGVVDPWRFARLLEGFLGDGTASA